MEKEYYIEVLTSAFDLLDATRILDFGGYVDRVDESYNDGYALLRTIPIMRDEYQDLFEELYDMYRGQVVEIID